MGSRGKLSSSYGRTGGIPPENREYSVVAMIGCIKVIQCDTKSNNPTITYSNTANTTYFSYSKKKEVIEHIYYYKNHKLVKSVDFNEGVKPHAHYWNAKLVGRKKHDKKNIHSLSDRDKRLLNQAIKFNKEHNKNENGK